MAEFHIDAQKPVAHVCVISVLFFVFHDNPKEVDNSRSHYATYGTSIVSTFCIQPLNLHNSTVYIKLIVTEKKNLKLVALQ